MNCLLQRIIVFVGNPRACAAFYRDHFAMQPIGDWTDEWAEVASSRDGCRLAFHQARENGKVITHATGSPQHPHKMAFLVDDVDAARAELVAKGVKMGKVWNVSDVPGLSFCDGSDMEGHRLQISTRK